MTCWRASQALQPRNIMVRSHGRKQFLSAIIRSPAKMPVKRLQKLPFRVGFLAMAGKPLSVPDCTPYPDARSAHAIVAASGNATMPHGAAGLCGSPSSLFLACHSGGALMVRFWNRHSKRKRESAIVYFVIEVRLYLLIDQPENVWFHAVALL